MKNIAQQQLMEVTRVDWETPDWLFRRQHEKYHFTVDVCADIRNHKLPRYWDAATDGLRQSWAGERCWMNPPYGREIKRWVQKACLEAAHDRALVVALLPVRTDTHWWHDWVQGRAEVEFLRGRVRFNGGRADAPFPSCIAVWGAS